MPSVLRIIPCLDVRDGRVVKGVKFENLKDAGDPAELAELYDKAGADELCLLDISASNEERATTREVVHRCAERIHIPLTVGGGVRGAEDAEILLTNGASKVSISTAALLRPAAIDEISQRFGPAALVLSLDARAEASMPSGYGVTTHGGRRLAGKDAVAWAREAQDRGVGEILLNSMDADGTTGGYDLKLLSLIRDAVQIPLIASGGAGELEHFVAAAQAGADALLAASVFHYRHLTIDEVKQALRSAGYAVSEGGSR